MTWDKASRPGLIGDTVFIFRVNRDRVGVALGEAGVMEGLFQ